MSAPFVILLVIGWYFWHEPFQYYSYVWPYHRCPHHFPSLLPQTPYRYRHCQTMYRFSCNFDDPIAKWSPIGKCNRMILRYCSTFDHMAYPFCIRLYPIHSVVRCIRLDTRTIPASHIFHYFCTVFCKWLINKIKTKPTNEKKNLLMNWHSH